MILKDRSLHKIILNRSKEGAATTLFGVVSLWLLPRSLSDARFLTSEERISLGETLHEDGMALIKTRKNAHVWDETLEVVKNPQVMLICFATFFGGSTESGLILYVCLPCRPLTRY